MARELPVLPRNPACPAALAITGACRSQQGVVCRIMRGDQERDAGLDMNPRQLEITREGTGGVYLNLKSDPGTVTGFCYGDAVPVVTDEDGQGRASYTFCPVFQRERNRHLAGRDDALFDPLEREPVSMGVSTLDADDPWQQARRDLEMFG